MTAPDRAAVERLLDRRLLDWQWNALLGILGHLPTTAPRPPAPKPPSPRYRAQDANHRTCEICGRTGSRRFVQTATGWRCSPTATACTGNRGSDIPAKDIQPNVTPEESPQVDASDPVEKVDTPPVPASRPAALTANVTARCQDCTRTWTLSGRLLDSAVEMHELKHGHIVNVYEDAHA
ncbi:hypothetical protein [Mycobacterium sp. NPDC050041]|uniref:hypothetical protein n=1 Tax=Mycobacterium sp. NPDC050041 TaxID=3364293 RepID=UPI003C3048D9